MKYIFHLFFGYLLVITMFLVLCTACVGSSPGDNTSGGTSSYEPYVITQTGNINEPNDLTTEPLDAEYSKFFLTSGTNGLRNIFLGGLIPQGTNPSKVKISSTGLNGISTKDVKIFSLFGNSYYCVQLPLLSTMSPGDYTFDAVLLDIGQTVLASREFDLKVGNLEDREWGLRVYQQQGYNKLDDTKDEIDEMFDQMGVYLGIDGANIINVNSSLPDAVIDYDHNNVLAEDNPLVIYAFDIIYPTIADTREAMDQYFSEHPNEGLLFFVKDYNLLNPPSIPPEHLGTTITGYWGNGHWRKAPISFIFVDRHIINFEWQGKYIQTTVLHELGHLWCIEFTDNDTHTFWHNSNDKTRCLMKSDLTIVNGAPDYNAEKVLNFRDLCTGHIQRGSNISWHLKQYSPFGEGTTVPDNILLASNTNLRYSLNDDLKIELSCNKTEFIQGESIDVLVKITNNTNNTFRMRPPKHYIYDFNKDSTFTSQFGNGLVDIPPSGAYYYMLDPTSYLVFSGIDFSSYTFKPGNYEYYISLLLGKEEFLSNKINIKINPVPDSLEQAFNDLKYVINKPRTFETSKDHAEKYRGTFYEQQFYFKLLKQFNFRSAIRNKDDAKEYRVKAVKLNKEFILKYPNTSYAYRLFQVIMYNYTDNQSLVEEILTTLKNNQPECKLLEVLRNQPEYLNKQIIYILD